MKRIYRRLICLVIILSMLMGLSTITLADEVVAQKIPLLSLGDSIATGFGLAHYDPSDLTKATDSYVNMLGASMHQTPINLAKDGLTSGGLLLLLEDAQVKAQLASSEVITISIGGNNVLQPMIGAIKTQFELGVTDTNDQLIAKINQVGLLDSLKKVQTALTAATPAIDQGVTAFGVEFPQIMSKLKESAPQARILVSTLYNAYEGVNIMGLDFHTETQKPLEGINAVITKTLADPLYAGSFEIVDVAKAFGTQPSSATKRYVNVDVSPLQLNLDPHPSAAGHEVIFDLYAHLLIKDFIAFTDISKHMAKNSIRYLAGLQIIGGVQVGSTYQFQPEGKLTRGQFVKILKGAVPGLNIPVAPAKTFIDVAKDKWYTPYVLWAVENGITNGNDKNEFGPNNNISRQDLAVMLYRLVKNSGYKIPSVPANALYADDKQIAKYAKEAVYALKASGFLIEKTGEKFNPTAQATRGETAMILANFVKAIQK